MMAYIYDSGYSNPMKMFKVKDSLSNLINIKAIDNK